MMTTHSDDSDDDDDKKMLGGGGRMMDVSLIACPSEDIRTITILSGNLQVISKAY